MNTTLERTRPLYRQLGVQIESKILNGDWPAGHRLPTTQEIATMFGVTIMTAQQGAAFLASQGLIERIPGRGTFVSNRITSRTIGIVFGYNVFGDPAGLFHQSLYGLICSELRRLKWNAELYFPSDEKAQEQMLSELGQDVESGRLRAVIPVCYGAPLALWLDNHPQIPCMNRHVAAPAPTDIKTDQVYHGVAYLLGRGYRRIAVVAHTGSGRVERMRANIELAYADCGLPMQATFHGGIAASHPAGIAQARAILDDPVVKPDAFLVLNDLACMGVIFELLCRRLRIPEDIGVMAHANKGIEIPCPVPLTRLEVDPSDHARRMIEETLALIEGREPERKPIKSVLIVGESCGESRKTIRGEDCGALSSVPHMTQGG